MIDVIASVFSSVAAAYAAQGQRMTEVKKAEFSAMQVRQKTFEEGPSLIFWHPNSWGIKEARRPPEKCKCCGSHEFQRHNGRMICAFCRVGGLIS